MATGRVWASRHLARDTGLEVIRDCRTGCMSVTVENVLFLTVKV